MKVSLVPLLYEEYNYGGVLQFYALQKVIQKMGYSCEILRVDAENNICPKVYHRTIKHRVLTPLRKIRSEIQTLLINKKIEERKRATDKFKEMYYSKTVRLEDVDINNYFAVICGSDQIWNPGFARERAFLSFVPEEINTIIYAASLGVESLTKVQKQAYKPRVERLRHVSVREHSAKMILDEFIDRDDIEVVLDPTLLLLQDEWEELCNDVKTPEYKYVFTYFLGDYSGIKGHIKDFADIRNLKIVNIPFASGSKIDREKFGDVKIFDAAPDEFLALIRNAEYVFTDSFHACVFSSIFEREFYVLERDGSKEMLGRINTLFQNFSLPNRIISTGKINELTKIDYSDFCEKQKALIGKSMKFLVESLNG